MAQRGGLPANVRRAHAGHHRGAKQIRSMSTKHNITAIIYDKRGRPLSVGYNSYEKTHPLQAKAATMVGEPYKVYLHAEIAAIVRLPYHARDKAHTMRVFRYNKHGKPMNAKPCSICQSILSQMNLKVEHT